MQLFSSSRQQRGDHHRFKSGVSCVRAQWCDKQLSLQQQMSGRADVMGTIFHELRENATVFNVGATDTVTVQL